MFLRVEMSIIWNTTFDRLFFVVNPAKMILLKTTMNTASLISVKKKNEKSSTVS